MTFILSLQQLLNAHLGAGLVEDDKLGKLTRFASYAQTQILQPEIWGKIPTLIGGRASYYGGKDDINDRVWGQAYLPAKNMRTPAQYYAEMPNDIKVFLRAEMADDVVWPWTTDDRRARKRAGISYYLNTDSYYCALRLTGSLATAARAGAVVMAQVCNARTGVVLPCRVIDFGPALTVSGKQWPFKIDLSPGLYRDLGLAWQKDRVMWAVSLEARQENHEQ